MKSKNYNNTFEKLYNDYITHEKLWVNSYGTAVTVQEMKDDNLLYDIEGLQFFSSEQWRKHKKYCDYEEAMAEIFNQELEHRFSVRMRIGVYNELVEC